MKCSWRTPPTPKATVHVIDGHRRPGSTTNGIPLLDPIAAFIVVGFIGRAGLEIALSTSHVLADRMVIGEEALRQVVMSVPGILGAHRIRTRGPAD